MSIDIDKRLKDRDLLLKYVRGEITNHDIDDHWETSDLDVSLGEIFGVIEHLFYQNQKQKFDMSSADISDKRLIIGCLAFLSSDRPLLWPSSKELSKYKYYSSLFGFVGRKKAKYAKALSEYAIHGDLKYWPFIDRAGFIESLSNCRKRNGSKGHS